MIASIDDTVSTSKVERVAARLDAAARSARAITQSAGEDLMSIREAYAVQRALVDMRVGRGAGRIGMKMGFTSRAKMLQMGLSDLIWGRLTRDMLVEDGGIDETFHIHPRVEPEICFLLKKPLSGVVTPLAALAAVEAIAPAIEIIDSRYLDFKFSLADVIADNASSSALVVGAWHAPEIDFSNLGLVLEVDGRTVEVGSTAAILGHPLRSLCAAARLAAQAGEVIEAGSLVMAGGATAAVAVRPGASVRCDMQHLGRVGCSMASAR
jgi:2-oxo-3-hexenedioate decarboxylase